MHDQLQLPAGSRAAIVGRPQGAFAPHGVSVAESAYRFAINVRGDLRTEGVAVDCPDRSACDLDGLDLDLLAFAAKSKRRAAASHKLLLIGRDCVAVHQLHPGRTAEIVFCGQATLAVASVAGRHHIAFALAGPAERRARVVQRRKGTFTRQWWWIEEFAVTEADWRGRTVAFCPTFNDYAVVAGPLPPAITPAQARSELFGRERLTNKLAVIEGRDSASPFVAVETAAGAHGAIPATGAATLAALARTSAPFAEILAGGAVAHRSKAGEVEMALPEVEELAGGGLSVAMPSADVILSPLIMEL